MSQRKTNPSEWTKKLRESLKPIHDSLEKLQESSLHRLMYFFHEYGFKKHWTTPRYKTLNAIAGVINKKESNGG